MELIRQDNMYKIVLKKAPKVNGHCPSVDVLFSSVAKHAKENAMGVILTGMGGDGAKGLLEMRKTDPIRSDRTRRPVSSTVCPRSLMRSGQWNIRKNYRILQKRIYNVLNK